MGRPAAALRTRRDAGGSIRHACVGIRRLHAHPRGRDLEPDDDDRPQRARSTFRNHAEPIHVEPLPRIAESLVVRKRCHHSLQGKGAQPENLHEQHRPRRRIPHLPVVLRPRRAGHDPVCQPRPGRYGPDLRGLRAVVRRAGRLAGKPEVPATDLVPVARNDGPPAGCRRTAALGAELRTTFPTGRSPRVSAHCPYNPSTDGSNRSAAMPRKYYANSITENAIAE